jgi:hypothetical protein
METDTPTNFRTGTCILVQATIECWLCQFLLGLHDPIAETLLCAIALLTAFTLFLSGPLSMKITHRVSLVDCGVEFAASCKLSKGTLDTKLTQRT